MDTLSLHDLEPDLALALREYSLEMGISEEEAVKRLLRKFFKLLSQKAEPNDFSAFLGLWSEKEFQEFHEAIAPLEKEEWISWDENEK